MNDNNPAANFKVLFTVAKQDSHLTMSSLFLQPSTLAMNFVLF